MTILCQKSRTLIELSFLNRTGPNLLIDMQIPLDLCDAFNGDLRRNPRLELPGYSRTPANETLIYSSGYSNPFLKAQTPQGNISSFKNSLTVSQSNLHAPLTDISHDNKANRLETSKSVLNFKAKEDMAEKNKQLVENILQKVLGNSGIGTSIPSKSSTTNLSRVSSCNTGDFMVPLRPNTSMNIEQRGSFHGKELAHNRTSIILGNRKGNLYEEVPSKKSSLVFSKPYPLNLAEKELNQSALSGPYKENLLAKSGFYQADGLFHLENKRNDWVDFFIIIVKNVLY